MTEYHDYQPAPERPVMTSNAASVARHIGQSTAIEQSRAVAEVQSLVIVAQNRPRNESEALIKLRRSTERKSLADKAFYTYPKGETQIKDLSINAVKELARCWGNMQYSVAEISQDLARGESEMLAWAWDMEANNRVERRKIVPHVRDVTDKKTKKKTRKTVTDFREIGEILGNWAARQLRECIKDVLPPWYLDEARAGFSKTLIKGLEEKPIEVLRADTVTAYERFEVTVDQLERYLDRPMGKWTVHDVARLRVTWTNVNDGTVRVEDEFPPEALRGADLAAAEVDPALAAAAAPVKPPAGVTDDQLISMLREVDYTINPDNPTLPAWTPEQRDEVFEWAGAQHLATIEKSPNPLARPDFLPDPDYVCDVCGVVGMHYQDEHTDQTPEVDASAE